MDYYSIYNNLDKLTAYAKECFYENGALSKKHPSLIYNLCAYLAYVGKLDLMRQAHKLGAPYTSELVDYLILIRADIQDIEYVINIGGQLSASTLKAAVSAEDLKSLVMLYDRQCPHEDSIVDYSISMRNTEVFKFVFEHYSPKEVTVHQLKSSIKHYVKEIFECVVSHWKGNTGTIVAFAMLYDRSQVLGYGYTNSTWCPTMIDSSLVECNTTESTVSK